MLRWQREEKTMTCFICRNGETQPGIVNVTLTRGETTVLLKGVPPDVCDNCGEYYLSQEIAAQVLDKAEQVKRNGAEVEILRFAA
jgi:YgiT-type zinc finger domain-containing protein